MRSNNTVTVILNNRTLYDDNALGLGRRRTSSENPRTLVQHARMTAQKPDSVGRHSGVSTRYTAADTAGLGKKNNIY